MSGPLPARRHRPARAPSGWRRRAGRFVPPARAAQGGAVAVLLCVALTAAACGNGGGSASGPSTSSPTTQSGGSDRSTTTSSTAPATTKPVLTAGNQGTRAAVPWAKVGAGWLLATWSTSPAVSSGAVTPPATVYLVDPQGGRYDLGPAPKTGVLTDWSGDGDEALFLVPTTPASTGTISYGAAVVNLRTGATSQFPVGAEVGSDAVQFSKPDGTAVVVAGPQVHRFSLSGTLEQTYPSSIPEAEGSGTTGGAFAEVPTGTELGLSGTGGIDVMTNGGKPLRFIGPPPGLQPCTVDGLWQATSVLESCGPQLWTQPLSGATASHLATAPTGPVLIDAWMVATRVVAEAGACGTTWLEAGNPGGTLSTISVPDVSSGGSVSPVGAWSTRLAVVLRPGCDGGTAQQQDTTLGWFDLATNAVTPLLGSLAAGGTVDAAVLFHGPSAGGGTQG